MPRLAVALVWNPEPVAVEVRRCSFLERAPFAGERPVLANAFHLQDVPYRWMRGVREPLPRSPGAAEALGLPAEART